MCKWEEMKNEKRGEIERFIGWIVLLLVILGILNLFLGGHGICEDGVLECQMRREGR